jgi:peptidoglycan/LPS O-acetylase OafA/YrhL
MRIAVESFDFINAKLNSLVVKHKGTDNATILRGFAALSVVLIHYDGFGARNLFPVNSKFDNSINFIINLGVYGPLIFFVASGFALTASYARKNVGLRLFVIQRFFRLWPLYCVVLVVTFVIRPLRGPISFSISNLIAHLSFLDPFDSSYFLNDPIGVVSSIPIEFWWSMSIPLIFWARSKSKPIAEVLIISTLIIPVIADFNLTNLTNLDVRYDIQLMKYGIYFYLGNLAWHIRPYILRSRYTSLLLLISFSTLPAIQLLNFESEVKVVMVSLIFLIFLRDIESRNKLVGILNNFFIAIGTVCYSIYLWHYPVLRLIAPIKNDLWLYLPVTFLTISILSVLSYLYIESKGILLGKVITKKIHAEHQAES